MQNNALSNRQVFILRVLVGLVFGLILSFLKQPSAYSEDKSFLPYIWNNVVYIGLFFSAFIIWAAAGTMRTISLGIWFAVAFILIGIIAWHNFNIYLAPNSYYIDKIFWLFPLVFIMNELIMCADIAHKPIAPYQTYFDETWKRGVQLGLALLFTGLMWIIIFLGAELLKVIGFDWLDKLTHKKWFNLPLSGIAMGIAVHLGDVQPKLLANVRNLVLNILSWLLILITAVGVIFVSSLFFSGLKPLWDTKSATASLLAACVFLVLLTNAAYGQGEIDGEDGKSINKALKISIRIASVLTLILSSIAAYGIYLRINQYGLTSDRVFAVVGVLIALAFGVSYTFANFGKNGFMPKIAMANIYLSIFECLIFVALMTPLAAPDRLGVNSQISRLVSGKTTIDKFDWEYLKLKSGKYGAAAIDKLTKNPKFASIATEVKNINRDEFYQSKFSNKSNEQIVQNLPNPQLIDTTKSKKQLPESFWKQAFKTNVYNVPNCLRNPESAKQNDEKCFAQTIDLNHDNIDEILFVENKQAYLLVFKNNVWTPLFMNGDRLSKDEYAKLKNGDYTLAKPLWDDVIIGDTRVRVGE
ncbi:DUF4153 domain-containing protein [Pseudaquidulcibacter saccharophilus]|uniref:DUF4153 domain-containing protein n=1 Tax=Pseudaquidulcibacter saccharophilus TaxID=2831900 RepID=UPI001EFF1F3A|nr:DUF4153 domain-containing protein [Pseudaquidulcibacter saccharophilus]